MNKILISLFFLLITNFNPAFGTDKARGFFISFGVGPRVPISNFAFHYSYLQS